MDKKVYTIYNSTDQNTRTIEGNAQLLKVVLPPRRGQFVGEFLFPDGKAGLRWANESDELKKTLGEVVA